MTKNTTYDAMRAVYALSGTDALKGEELPELIYVVTRGIFKPETLTGLESRIIIAAEHLARAFDGAARYRIGIGEGDEAIQLHLLTEELQAANSERIRDLSEMLEDNIDARD